MSLWERFQKEKEIDELRRRNEIEAAKVKAIQQLKQNGKEKLQYCPHCGKPLP